MDGAFPASAPADSGDRRALDDLGAALGADVEVLRLRGRGAVATVFLARERAPGAPGATGRGAHA